MRRTIKSLGGTSGERGSQRPRPITRPMQFSRSALKHTYAYRSSVTLPGDFRHIIAFAIGDAFLSEPFSAVTKCPGSGTLLNSVCV